MWIAGDGIMFALMMLVFLMWSQDERAAVSGRSWFERARTENMATLVASHQPGTAAAGAGDAGTAGPGAGARAAALAADNRSSIDDDAHLAAYNAYLARLNQTPPTGTG